MSNRYGSASDIDRDFDSLDRQVNDELNRATRQIHDAEQRNSRFPMNN